MLRALLAAHNVIMCYNCGCFNPDDDMGSADNITEKTLVHIGEHWGTSLIETKKTLLGLLETNDKKLDEDEHLKEMFEKAAREWGQSIEEAKKNTFELLRSQIGKKQ